MRKEETEAKFLARYDVTKFERPSVAVDVALLSVRDGALYTLLLKRGEHPFKGKWSLPGGFVRMDETLEKAARRLLEAKAGLKDVFLEQLYTFDDPKRDPRTRVIAVAFYALVDRKRFEARKKETCVAKVIVPWAGETGGPVELESEKGEPLAMAFDHDDILGMATKRIRGKLDWAPIGFQLLGDTFTLLDLQRVHETILGRPLNKDSFRRRMLASGELEATGKTERDVDHRPAELYRFVKRSAV